jgi:group I intron endonuclease
MIGIYRLKNKLNGHAYIGQSKDIKERINTHIRSANNPKAKDYEVAIHRAIRKYGIENFEISIIEQCPENLLNKREIYWIEFYDTYNNGYNETKGGQGVCNIGDKHPNRKLSETEIIDIRTRYNNHERKKDVYTIYKDRINKTGFHKIWNGITWKHIMPEVYTQQNINFHKRNTGNSGETNGRTKLANEDVRKIRDLYNSGMKSKEIYEMYTDKLTYKSFMNIICNQNWNSY